MRVTLDILEGPRKGQTLVFDGPDTCIVGRSKFVHCPIPEDSGLSRDHFLIEIDPPRCVLRDLGSTNGTFLNERRVDRSRLAPGDLIAAGLSVFRVQFEGEARSPTDSWMDPVAPASDGEPNACARCGMLVPPVPDWARDPGGEATRTILWMCELCRILVAATPQLVPSYTTLRELGREAMGVVYQARHNQTGRMVALIVINPVLTDAPMAIERFMREMSVIEPSKYPRIGKFLEQGATGGRLWFAMEYGA